MFVQFNGNPCGRSTGDCVIRAISVAENLPWRSVYLALCVEGYDTCAFGDDNRTWEGYLTQIGYRRFDLPENKNYKLKDFALAHKEGIFIVGTGEHATTVMNGDIIDAWDCSEEVPKYYFSKTNTGGDI